MTDQMAKEEWEESRRESALRAEHRDSVKLTGNQQRDLELAGTSQQDNNIV